MTIELVDIEAFNKLAAEVAELQAEREFFRSLLTAERWLTRTQAMAALGCKDNKLRALSLDRTLMHRYEGKHVFYDAFSIRTYLTGQHIEQNEADKRILSAKFSK